MKTLQQIVDESRSIVFFGGAGVSTESGIPDFRSADGLYNQKYDVPPEELLSHEYFFEHTEKFFEFYREKMLCLDAKPNKAHLKLAELEKAGKLTAVITQNIDGLHTAAGSKTVYELHGSVHRNYCLKCGKSYSAQDILKSEGVPHCECGEIIKPEEPNCYKFETFIFDSFSKLDNMEILRGKREEEFAPVKNKEGVDSPETALKLYKAYYNLK